MIRIPRPELERIREEARKGYPEEICGVLLGPSDGGNTRNIVRAVPVANARDAERARRYLIDAHALREIEASAQREGLEVLGFYHSHPDHPAVPSAYDLEHSWPWYTYVIVSVERGTDGMARAWRLADDRSTFREETIMEDDR